MSWSKRAYGDEFNPTPRRITALYALIDAGSRMNINDLQPLAGFSDVRVLLLSLAECALYGLVEISDDKTITITPKGCYYAHENIDQILPEYRAHKEIKR